MKVRFIVLCCKDEAATRFNIPGTAYWTNSGIIGIYGVLLSYRYHRCCLFRGTWVTRHEIISLLRETPRHIAIMGSADEGSRTRAVRKLVKKKRPQRLPSVHYPERLQPGEDVQDDVTAPKGTLPQYMNQSVFGMIAAAGSKSDFHARFDDDSSGSDDETEVPRFLRADDGTSTKPSGRSTAEQQAESQRAEDEYAEAQPGYPTKRWVIGKDGQKRPESRLRRSIPRLNLRTIKEKNYMSESTILPSPDAESPPRRPNVATPRDAPVMSRMLEAQAQVDSAVTGLEKGMDVGEMPKMSKSKGLRAEGKISLATRLKEIFGFEKPEEVVSGPLDVKFLAIPYTDAVSEYPCWLLQSVLLQGYMYITEHHICFYAYLPKKSVSYSTNLL